ncbi:MAG: hypothetical protein M3335_07405 [Actinomycetota bacterium]|nr:hypothetical protein [Actinomycetota bacterium]
MRGRWWERYSGLHMREPEDDFAPHPTEEPDVSSTWVQTCACLTFALVVLGLPALGALKLIELLRRFGLWRR